MPGAHTPAFFSKSAPAFRQLSILTEIAEKCSSRKTTQKAQDGILFALLIRLQTAKADSLDFRN